MSDFEINKGVGREVEFKGLRAQYLFPCFRLKQTNRAQRHLKECWAHGVW